MNHSNLMGMSVNLASVHLDRSPTQGHIAFQDLSRKSANKQQPMAASGFNPMQTMTQNYSSRRQGGTSATTISITNEKLNKHLDSCTPVRRDTTPNRENNSAIRMQQQSTPTQHNTPSNMRLRIS